MRERYSIAEPTLAERSHRRSEAKAAIARRALEIIGDRFRGSVYLDAGTTTEAIAAFASATAPGATVLVVAGLWAGALLLGRPVLELLYGPAYGRDVPLFALLGYGLGVALHMLWNASAVLDIFLPNSFYTLYALVEVPIFLLFIGCIVRLRREEMRLTRERLGEYAGAGWFTWQEVDMLATAAGRRAGRRWAMTRSARAVALMNSFIRDATALAMARQRALTGRDPGAIEDEHLLLHRAAATRRAMLAS